MNVADLAHEMAVIRATLEQTLMDSEVVVGHGDEKPALDFLLQARESHRLTGDLARIAEDMIVDLMGDRRRAVVGEHSLEVRRAYKRTDWEHSKVATHVALRATGGELVEGMPEVIDAFLKACNPSWRVTALKDMGLVDDDYCSKELQRATVQVIS